MHPLSRIAAVLPFNKPRETPAERNKRIVREFIERTPKQAESVRDAKLLPHPKEEIQAVLLWFMDTHATTRSMFGPMYLGTASYQKDFKGRDALEALDAVFAEREALNNLLRQRGYA